MDQNSADTDPKLKEAYDRVMGNLTVVPSTPLTGVAPVDSSQPTPSPVTQPQPVVLPVEQPSVISIPSTPITPDSQTPISLTNVDSTSLPSADTSAVPVDSGTIIPQPVSMRIEPDFSAPLIQSQPTQPQPIQPASVEFSGSSAQTVSGKKNPLTSLPFVVSGIVLFFGAYTVLWMKVLSIPPF